MKFTPKELTPYLSARHYFGSEQRRHRDLAKLSLVQLAEIVNFSKSTLGRVETAELLPPPELPSALDAAFGTDKHFHGLYQLARREAHPDQFRRLMELEAEAVVIETFATLIMPGLLQTAEYARTLLSQPAGVAPDLIEERVQVRLGRQERLRSPNPPRYWAILDEAILYRPVGGTQVMRDQLKALLPLVDTPTTKIQVLPFVHGGYELMDGPTLLLRLPGGKVVAYDEYRARGHLMEDPTEVNQRWASYDALRAYALSPQDSGDLIRHAMKGYEECEAAPN
ncbi:transcriptional regulator [Streptomyces nigrescens]|uniref:Transcriptional regulator n=2 Tax=Streptomyces TaxID=1883 RepID=A0ABM7ZNF5_STRNI|nr:helix-turn-helix transcriptional regulator [Streptomyces nigrescens]MEE4424264.1 helix-turn-helix transcriptional regulator [Streptomyces sp. DSM 41528]BDM67848.1 transcriptional regulator [Streptomyces nigrescens]